MTKASTAAARDEAPTYRFFQSGTALNRMLREMSGWFWEAEPTPAAPVPLRKCLFLTLCVKLYYLRLRPDKADIGKTRTFFDRKLLKVFVTQVAKEEPLSNSV